MGGRLWRGSQCADLRPHTRSLCSHRFFRLSVTTVTATGYRATFGRRPIRLRLQQLAQANPQGAVLLVKQLGIFRRAAQPDRTLKFVRIAYVWLLAAAAMLPFFLPYGFWTRQGFAHDYMAAYHHAYTVGFVSMMIVGVAARVVPILAGLDASRLSRLWGPFLLLNIGCIGRVSLLVAPAQPARPQLISIAN